MTRTFLASLALCAALWPFSAAVAVDRPSGFVGMRDSPYYRYEVRGQSSVSLRLSQSLWEGGATQARIAMEKARLASARHAYADAAASLAFDAVAAHAEILRQARLVDLASRNVNDYASTIAMLQARAGNGLATPGDVDLVKSRLLRARGVLAEYRSALLGAKANFQKITGRPAPRSLAAMPLPRRAYTSAASAIASSRVRNPRILAQAGVIEAAREEVHVAEGAFHPKVAIQAGPRWHFQDTPQDSRNHGVEAMLTAQWNLFEGGATSAARERAVAQTRQARHDLRHVADSVEAEILSVWAHYEAAAERMGFYGESMRVAKEARKTFHEQYMLGYKGLLDLLDADNEYFIAACQHTVAEGDRLVAAYRLLALGGEILPAFDIPLPAFDAPATGKQRSSLGRAKRQ